MEVVISNEDDDDDEDNDKVDLGDTSALNGRCTGTRAVSVTDDAPLVLPVILSVRLVVVAVFILGPLSSEIFSMIVVVDTGRISISRLSMRRLFGSTVTVEDTGTGAAGPFSSRRMR